MDKIIKTTAQWRSQLTELQFHVTREHGTERAFTGEYWDVDTDGIYRCRCCGQALFDSTTKFDPGCGWPSYWQAIAPGALTERVDRSYGMVRTEVLCSRCDAHLGHVFDDGPDPTGLRYCMNSASLQLTDRSADDAVKS
jgi:peptide-methionine (R)-S-oxide reductase